MNVDLYLLVLNLWCFFFFLPQSVLLYKRFCYTQIPFSLSAISKSKGKLTRTKLASKLKRLEWWRSDLGSDPSLPQFLHCNLNTQNLPIILPCVKAGHPSSIKTLSSNLSKERICILSFCLNIVNKLISLKLFVLIFLRLIISLLASNSRFRTHSKV